MPLLQLIIFGYAMNMELRRAPLAVLDLAGNSASEQIRQDFSHSRYFELKEVNGATTDPATLMESSGTQAVLVIGRDFGVSDRELLLLIDASDPNTAQLIQAYAEGIVGWNTALRISPVKVESRVMFNPELNSAFFFVPGLVAMILVMVCALLTSISLTREKELGTMEQLLVSPLSAQEILLGKITPYVFLAFVDAMLILVAGMLLFKVPFMGNVLEFMGFTFLYVLTALCLGLLVSTLAKTQQAAMMMALAATLLPTLMLSGFIFPIASMPQLLQWISSVVPARYYLRIIRGIMLKGNGIDELWTHGACLAGVSLLMLAAARQRFSLRLK
jgi:ABC-2 type transport system permease protein